MSGMYTTAAKLKEMHYFTRLNKEFHSDLARWHVFLQNWNGINLLRFVPTTLPDCTIYTDTSGSWSCCVTFPRQWLQWQWPPLWSSYLNYG